MRAIPDHAKTACINTLLVTGQVSLFAYAERVGAQAVLRLELIADIHQELDDTG